MSSPFATLTAAALSDAFARDWADLGARFIAATGSYILGYKTPVLIIACVGLYFTCVQKRPAALIALVSFAAIYLVSLYWYHLSCFGEFYFTRLNSIERFTRVVLQPLHALGLLGFTLVALSLVQGRISSDRRIPAPDPDSYCGDRCRAGWTSSSAGEPLTRRYYHPEIPICGPSAR